MGEGWGVRGEGARIEGRGDDERGRKWEAPMDVPPSKHQQQQQQQLQQQQKESGGKYVERVSWMWKPPPSLDYGRAKGIELMQMGARTTHCEGDHNFNLFIVLNYREQQQQQHNYNNKSLGRIWGVREGGANWGDYGKRNTWEQNGIMPLSASWREHGGNWKVATKSLMDVEGSA